MRHTKKLGALALAGTVGGLLAVSSLAPAGGSSHREAPLITEDPVADNTDVYAFVAPDAPNALTIVANWIPLEEPAGGPNFAKFGDDVLYELNIDNDGNARPDISYQFRFNTNIQNPNTFLYNTGPITSLRDPDFNQRQAYTVAKVEDGVRTIVGNSLPTPPVNIGPRSTPNYAALAQTAVRTLSDGSKVFAGQRDDPFFVDLGSIFDLGGLRPLNPAHLVPLPASNGIDNVAGYNTHSIVLQVPLSEVIDEDPVVGIWSATYRQKTRFFENGDGSTPSHFGGWVQISRLGMPLVNEVVIPVGEKDLFNASKPIDDGQFLGRVTNPELQGLLPVLYPGAFSCLPTTPRNDLVAIFLTGLSGINQPDGVVPSEQLRINTSLPSGFPNGRTLADDVVDTSLVAVAGGLSIQECAGQSPNKDLTDGVSKNDVPLKPHFPYVPTPHSGYDSDENGDL